MRRVSSSRVLAVLCVVLAVLGIGAAVLSVHDGDAVLGGFFVVLTVLLLPAYLLWTQPVRQRARRDAERRASAAGSGSGTVAGPGQAAGPAARADEPGEIVVRRPRGYHYAVFRRYRILIDGRAAGTVARGAELRTAVAPGSHTVVARIDWTGSPEVTVDVPPGRRVVLEVEPAEDPIAGMFSTDRALTLSVRP